MHCEKLIMFQKGLILGRKERDAFIIFIWGAKDYMSIFLL